MEVEKFRKGISELRILIIGDTAVNSKVIRLGMLKRLQQEECLGARR